MNGNNLTNQPAYGPVPLSNGAKPLNRHSRRGCWRVLAIISGSCLGLILLVALTVVILGSLGKLSGTPGHLNEEPAWSPDGSQIAFASDRKGNYDIYVMNSDGSNVRQLTSNPFAYLYFIVGNAADYGPTWSPDGKKIAFVSGRNNSAWSFVDTDIFIMDADGRNVVSWEGSQYYSADNYPEWSPDGCCIVYTSSKYPYVNDSEVPDIFSAYANPANDVNITNLTNTYTENSSPSWSPQGERIVFASVRNGNWDIYMMNKSGSEIVQLTHSDNFAFSPDWSPDGTRIAFAGGEGEKCDIFVMNTDGTNNVRLTNGPASYFSPAWSPDSRRIAFVSDQGGINQVKNIYVMDADGSNIIQLTK
jgi:TolB protein